MRAIKNERAVVGVGRHSAIISRHFTIHVWRGTYAAWSVCWNVGHPWRRWRDIRLGWGGCLNWGKAW